MSKRFEECAGLVLLGSGDMYPAPSIGERYASLILFVGFALFVLWRLAHETYVQFRDRCGLRQVVVDPASWEVPGRATARGSRDLM
jgi:hypothetical protein